MRQVKTINYKVKNGENFKVNVFSIDRTKHHSVTYHITSWAYHLTDDPKRDLKKLLRDTRITIFQNLDTSLFGENYIVVDNISQAKTTSHHTPLMIEITFFMNDTLTDAIIINTMNKLTDKLNHVYQDSDTLLLSQNKHVKEMV